jgi:hypothetical protein
MAGSQHPQQVPDQTARGVSAVTEKRPASRRGTSNGNSAGSAEDRRRRKLWLLETYRADVDVFDGLARWDRPIQDKGGILTVPVGDGEIACRCYRCGLLLIFDTLTVDRIKPGCQGGTYRRENCRPSCMACAQKTGGRLGGLNRAG